MRRSTPQPLQDNVNRCKSRLQEAQQNLAMWANQLQDAQTEAAQFQRRESTEKNSLTQVQSRIQQLRTEQARLQDAQAASWSAYQLADSQRYAQQLEVNQTSEVVNRLQSNKDDLLSQIAELNRILTSSTPPELKVERRCLNNVLNCPNHTNDRVTELNGSEVRAYWEQIERTRSTVANLQNELFIVEGQLNDAQNLQSAAVAYLSQLEEACQQEQTALDQERESLAQIQQCLQQAENDYANLYSNENNLLYRVDTTQRFVEELQSQMTTAQQAVIRAQSELLQAQLALARANGDSAGMDLLFDQMARLDLQSSGLPPVSVPAPAARPDPYVYPGVYGGAAPAPAAARSSDFPGAKRASAPRLSDAELDRLARQQLWAEQQGASRFPGAGTLFSPPRMEAPAFRQDVPDRPLRGLADRALGDPLWARVAADLPGVAAIAEVGRVDRGVQRQIDGAVQDMRDMVGLLPDAIGRKMPRWLGGGDGQLPPDAAAGGADAVDRFGAQVLDAEADVKERFGDLLRGKQHLGDYLRENLRAVARKANPRSIMTDEVAPAMDQIVAPGSGYR